MREIGKRVIFTIVALLATIGFVNAQQFTLNAPQRVFKGEKFHITFRLSNADASEPRAPEIAGCKLIFGPSVTRSKSYQVSGNGQMSSQSSTEFTFVYRADKTGEFSIAPTSILVNGKTLRTRAHTLTVVDGPAQGSTAPQPSSSTNRPVSIDDIETQSADRSVSANDVFVRIILSKPTAYEQEAIECTIKLYTKFGISQFFPTKQPNFDGFLIEEINFQSSLNQVETYNGQRYLVALLKKCIIFPQKSGKLTINSGNYDINVIQYNNTNLGFLSMSTPKERKIQVTSNTASIDIKPLPTPQPEGFNGAVGQFKASCRLIGSKFLTNDAGSLLYTITGTGNIKYLKEPVIDFPSEFEVYSPKTTYDTRVVGQNVTGTMTTEYSFVPQSVGKFTIGSDKFVYFDPEKKEYITLETPTFPISVGQGAEGTAKKDVEVKNKDIYHIVTGDKHPSFVHSNIVTKWWYWLIYVILIIALVSAVKLYGRSIARAADVRGMRLAKANKIARKRLKAAYAYMQSGQRDKFHEELLRTLWGYLSDKLGIPVSQLTRENVTAELTRFGASESTCASIIEVLDECEMARYAPVTTQERVQHLYDQAADSINELEKIKQTK